VQQSRENLRALVFQAVSMAIEHVDDGRAAAERYQRPRLPRDLLLDVQSKAHCHFGRRQPYFLWYVHGTERSDAVAKLASCVRDDEVAVLAAIHHIRHAVRGKKLPDQQIRVFEGPVWVVASGNRRVVLWRLMRDALKALRAYRRALDKMLAVYAVHDERFKAAVALGLPAGRRAGTIFG
jgi:hypothetical protein